MSMLSYSLAQVTAPTSFPRSPLRSSKSSATGSSDNRSTSPVKRANDLMKLDKPVYVNFNISRPELQSKMQQHGSGDLLKRIETILRRGYLPIELRDILDAELMIDDDEEMLYAKRPRSPIPDTRSLLDSSKLLISTAFESLFPSGQSDKSKTHELLPTFLHIQSLILELDSLRKIVSTTNEYTNVIRAKASWDEQVYGRMLELAVLHVPGVSVENITRANIAKEFLPPMSNRPKFSSPSSKGIDYAMVLQPFDSPSARSDKNNDLDKRLTLSRIRSFLGGLAYPSFNQSSYAPLCDMPSGIFIKTEINSQNTSEAIAQLGIWLSSWYSRVSEFPRSDESKRPALPVLPILQATSVSWYLWFAFDMGSYYEICGHISIPSTGELINAYRLLGVLHILANWMATDFYEWVDRCLKEAGV
ncbi:hypothetical protein EKO27_g3364 [Xylaria grammica]|uniref:PD-(D/E)XK nuclease-like domain-containing protein n=1 Tax=Xylaria grammica TaxID=363999 RepID=A0A439DBH7_9PEZI|nr:hypothetical protein EKO27_g3364 [Xylaria grammica]